MSHATSTTPSATRQYCQKSGKHRADHACSASDTHVRGRRQPGSVIDTAASATRATADTRAAEPSTNAPPPRSAHHRRRSAGAETTEQQTTPSRSSATMVAHTGEPRTYDFVPSIGSTIHRAPPATDGEPPPSSPNTSSPRPDAATSDRTASSAARSAADTGERSGFSSTRRSSARNRASVIASAASASACANSRSRLTPRPYLARDLELVAGDPQPHGPRPRHVLRARRQRRVDAAHAVVPRADVLRREREHDRRRRRRVVERRPPRVRRARHLHLVRRRAD